MTSIIRGFIPFVLALLASSCTSGFDAAALDGPWSSGHSLLGIGLAMDLTWEASWIRGHGSFASGAGAHCGNETFSSAGTLEFFALRQSATQIAGWMTFGDSTRFRYEGTLSGSSNIDGSLIAADGTTCPLPIFNGLVP